MKGITKQALAVPLSDAQRQKMALENIYVVPGLADKLKNVGKRELKAILQDSKIAELFATLGAKATLELPKVFMPAESNIVDINGQQYFLIDVQEPTTEGRGKNKTQVPGDIICVKPGTGEIAHFDYDQYADKIKRPTTIKDEVLATANKTIEQWNERVDKIQDALGLTTLPLQILWAENRIDERLETLNGMIGSTQAKIINPKSTASYDEYIEDLKTQVALGNLSLKGLISGITSGSIVVPPALKDGVLAIAYQEEKGAKESKEEKAKKDQEREDRIQQGLPEEQMPDVGKLNPP